jgi:hypothetical protein
MGVAVFLFMDSGNFKHGNLHFTEQHFLMEIYIFPNPYISFIDIGNCIPKFDFQFSTISELFLRFLNVPCREVLSCKKSFRRLTYMVEALPNLAIIECYN